MVFAALLVLCTLPAVTHQASLRASSLANTEAELSELLSADRALAEPKGLISSLEKDVSRIWQVMHKGESLMQLTSETQPKDAPKAAAAAVAAAAPKPAAAVPKAVAAAAAPKAAPHKKGLDAATAVKQMNALPPGQMAPMLGLLTGMYDSWKDKIGEANKHEQEQKKAYEKEIAEMEAKKAANKGKEGSDTYDRIEAYWKKQRSISHRQYHTALKIMHSGMQKFKSVSAAMKNAIAGKKPSAKDLQTVGLAMPDVVFLQMEHLSVWVQGATKELHGASAKSA